MRIALLAAYYELLQFFRLKSIVLILFGMPLLLIFILGNGLDTSIRSIDVAIWNDDGSVSGRAFDDYAASEGVQAHMSVWQANSEEEVEERLRSGKADYGIVIPAGYAAATLDTAPPLIVYPGELADRNLKAEAILEGFLSQIELSRAAAVAFGGSPRQADEAVLGLSGPESLDNGANVEVGTLVAGSTVEFGSVSSLQYYATAYLVMFLLFSGMSAAISTIEQREQGTLRRLRSLPIPISQFMLGKYAGYVMLAMLQSAVIVTVTKYGFGVQWGTSYGWILAICMLTALAAISLAIILTSFLHNRKSVESIFSMAVVMMTFLSGGMIPTLSPVIRDAGKLTINHWANAALKSLMIGGSWQDIREAFLMLAAIAAVLVVLMLIRLGRVAAPR
jgi:ABC-2 type transport system permease protein